MPHLMPCMDHDNEFMSMKPALGAQADLDALQVCLYHQSAYMMRVVVNQQNSPCLAVGTLARCPFNSSSRA